jgi:hypothetical protein
MAEILSYFSKLAGQPFKLIFYFSYTLRDISMRKRDKNPI